MNSLKYFFISVVSVYSLTLNEKALRLDSVSESSNREPLAHRSQKEPPQSHKGILNVEEALAQLRDALHDKKVDLAENSTHLQAEEAKSLILSSVSRKPDTDKQTSTKKLSSKKIQRNQFDDVKESAWAQSGGGCHSMVVQFAYMHAFEVDLKLWVKRIVQGEPDPADGRASSTHLYLAEPSQQSTSSGGAWGVFGATAAVSQDPARSFNRRSELSYVDAIIVPNENPRNWRKIIQHNIDEKKKSSASLIRKGDKGMITYENMIKSSLNFYLQVRMDPSLKDLAARDIFQAELAAQVSKAGPEVQAIAAQYDVTPPSHPALLAAIKQKDVPAVGAHPNVRTFDIPDSCRGHYDPEGFPELSGQDCTCEVLDDSWFVKCDYDNSFALFGGAVTCVAQASETDGTKHPWGWIEVVYNKFLKPWGIQYKTLFGYKSEEYLEQGSGQYANQCFGRCKNYKLPNYQKMPEYAKLQNLVESGDTVMVTTLMAVDNLFEVHKDVDFETGKEIKIGSSAKTRLAELLATAGGFLPETLAETSNFGLSFLYLFYYTKVYLGCGANIAGAVKYAKDKNVTQKFISGTIKAGRDVVKDPTKTIDWYFDAFMEINYLPPTKSFYFFDYMVEETDQFLFDGLSADNNALIPLIMMIASQQYGRYTYAVTPSVLVASTGDDEFDFYSIAQYFLDALPRKFTPPAAEIALSMDYLCDEFTMYDEAYSPNYILNFDGACMKNDVCAEFRWDWYSTETEGTGGFYYGKSDPSECLTAHGEENIWSKVKKTGILYLQQLDAAPNFFETHGWMLPVDEGAESHAKIDYVYIEAMVFAMSVKNDMATSWISLGGEIEIEDPNLANFPTFGKSSLMNVPLHYAWLLTAYVTHLTWVQLNCLSGDENKCDSDDSFCDCASMRCPDYYQVTFAYIPQLTGLGSVR